MNVYSNSAIPDLIPIMCSVGVGIFRIKWSSGKLVCRDSSIVTVLIRHAVLAVRMDSLQQNHGGNF
jgi:hypothetical protein